MEHKNILDDNEIRIKGIDALNKALGVTAALRFLSLISKDKTDYVEISKMLYENQSIDDIFERAKLNWKD